MNSEENSGRTEEATEANAPLTGYRYVTDPEASFSRREPNTPCTEKRGTSPHGEAGSAPGRQEGPSRRPGGGSAEVELAGFHAVDEGVPLGRGEKQLGAVGVLGVAYGDQIGVSGLVPGAAGHIFELGDLNAVTAVVAAKTRLTP